ncbi:Predicted DNA-binding transcriptional regulator YafY, contains an HTH and WYL domains [Microlunatus sagamiharensis]|uniref:Predicted DNA-binding transcriptional regulator YafY, contains an HTH and WYL domains n=1 Tax=Microlunatus sagamiharensis TaxID=546874 RepID=A0A1H2LNK6_9ACTN|nr:WYL domain-containing protein [Microlunatus sagamiharensis]SDU82597.1 Predicted DNA-binding transcriptional regulator YafY, contains an HTH and WYL domains [Microlunatus sagamiharensis]
MRADRLVSLLLLLQSRRRLTAAEAAQELEVSVPTVRRDLEALSAAGVPVYAQPGRGGGWSLVGGARTDLSGLTAPEVRALFLLVGPGSDVSPAVRTALRKLVRALPSTFREQAETAGSAVVLDRRRWGAEPVARPPHLDALERAVVERRRVRLAHAGSRGGATERDVEPLGLVDHDGTWYLLAGTVAGQRTFRVDRVSAVTGPASGEERFEPPPGFDLGAAWAAVAAGIERARSAVEATLTLPEDRVGAFRDVLGPAYVDVVGSEAGRTRLRARADTATMLARQLAGWADLVVVEGPEEVRAELVRLGASLTTAYGT